MGDVDATRLANVSAKQLYLGYTSSFPPPKVMFKFAVEWSVVWKRLDSPVLDPLAREYFFMIINNIVPNRERLFMKMHMVNSPQCVVCHVREDNTHMFMECVMVREAWGWVRLRLLSMLPADCAVTSNFEFLNLMFEQHVMDNEAVWLIGAFLEFVWMEKLVKHKLVKLEHLIGYVELKFKANHFAKKPVLGHIIGIK